MAPDKSRAGHGKKKDQRREHWSLEKADTILSIISSIITIVTTIIMLILALK